MTSPRPRTVRQSAFQRTMCCAHGVADPDKALKNQPNNRFIEVAELAGLALFLCTDNGASVTAVALPMDGGWTAH